MKMLRWAGLALLVPLLAWAAPAQDPVLAEAAQDASTARQLAGSPRAIAYLLRLHELREQVPDLNLLAQTYAELAYHRSTHPEVRRIARLLLSDVERARGRLVKSDDALTPLGFVHPYYVLGGFDNEGKSGCDTDYGPEKSLDLTKVYPGKERDTSWRRLEVIPKDGYVDLNSTIRPNKSAVAYALTFLDSSADTRTELSLGTSGAYKLWVNGELAASQTRYNEPRPDQARVSVRLRKGVNRVMLKVCNDSGSFGFYLRQEPAQGASVHAVLPTVLPPMEKGPSPQPKMLPTAIDLMAQEVAKHPADAQLRGEYATMLSWFRTFDETEHTDLDEAEKAADAGSKDVTLQLLAAKLHTDDVNLRRRYVMRALQADPTSPKARIALAQLELDRDHPDRALAVLDPLLKEFPGSVAGHLARAQAFGALEEWPRAAHEIEQTFQSAPQIPMAVQEAARISRKLDRPREAIQRLRVAAALRFDDGNVRRGLSSILADLGEVDDAAHELSVLLKLFPFDNGTRLRLAELYASNGKLDEGLQNFKDAAALAPDEPEVFERQGRALLEANKRDEAIAAFEKSLQLRPQNPPLREAMRALQGQDASYGAQYAMDVLPLAKEAEAFKNEDAVYLVDYSYTRVQSSGLSSRFQQLAVKVNTQRGVDAFRSFPITFSPDRQEVNVLKVRITKPDGSVVESFGDSDRQLNEPWTGMYYDSRARQLSFPSLAPGDILELQFRLEDTARDNLLSDYWGNVDYVQTVAPKLHYRFMVDMPSSRPLYWNKAQLGEAVKSEQKAIDGGRTLYTWSADNVAKITPEPSMPGYSEVATTLHVSTYKSWSDVGRYWWGLVRDQLTPNEDLRKTVDQALTGVDRQDQLAVVRAIYDYVVTNTRYVALEFGIHGYKPYRVDRILARRFGDCKDKASLIHAMLKVAGVDSRLVLLRMRSLGTMDSEPASLAAFNHAIVYVPQFDLYLDGTAEFHGAKELPSADHVANALIVDPNGNSQFVTTPEANAKDNLTALTMNVDLAEDGSAKLSGDTTVNGQYAPQYRRSYQAQATRKATFERGWAQSFPGVKVSKVELNDVSRIDDPVKLQFEMQAPRYAEVLPSALRFYPFGSGRAYAQAYAPLVKRTQDLVMDGPWTSSFSFRFTLPAGYSVSDVPPEVKEDSPFGYLHMKHRIEDGKLVSEGELAFTVARVTAKDYPQFRAWLARVDQAFARKVTVHKSNAGKETAAK